MTDRPLIHGVRSTYVNYRCRCEECKEANAEYKTRKVRDNIHAASASAITRLFESEIPDDYEHGTAVAYEWHGCRCEDCKEAAREAWKQARQLRFLRR